MFPVKTALFAKYPDQKKLLDAIWRKEFCQVVIKYEENMYKGSGRPSQVQVSF